MKLYIRLTLSVLMLFVGLVSNAQADHPKPPADKSSAELNRIKSLVGRWSVDTDVFGKAETRYVEYEITAGGSAVLEKIFPGTPEEMISVYYDDDNGKLAMTHYCMMRNRPSLALVSSNKNTINLDVTKIEGVKSSDAPSMGSVSIKFKDKNHFQTTCKASGKGADKPMTMEYKRVSAELKK